ncbi:Alpha/Beta hydrolase protein [Aspergillus unguis]
MSYLPPPSHTFTIPSLYDGIALDCRIYLPDELLDKQTTPWSVRGAIVAHPYASLGGCYDDPVVSFIGGELLDNGYVVGTFNFRGAGGSEGRTSWSAKPELADYVSFYGFMMLYLNLLRLEVVSRPGKGDLGRVELVLGGYSYGSMIASHLPGCEVTADLFWNQIQGSPTLEIFFTAKKICSLSKDEIAESSESSGSKPVGDYEPKDLLHPSSTSISYLLVSPLLPPINLFLTLFLDMSLEISTQASGQRRQIPCPKPTDQLCAHRSLAIYGDDDNFTSVSKLRKWSGELNGVPQSQFRSTEVEGAGHFWREDGAEQEARQALRLWLRQ